MATTDELKERIAAFARELAAELGEVDDSNALSWLDAIETQAVAIGDAIGVEVDCPFTVGMLKKARRSWPRRWATSIINDRE